MKKVTQNWAPGFVQQQVVTLHVHSEVCATLNPGDPGYEMVSEDPLKVMKGKGSPIVCFQGPPPLP